MKGGRDDTYPFLELSDDPAADLAAAVEAVAEDEPAPGAGEVLGPLLDALAFIDGHVRIGNVGAEAASELQGVLTGLLVRAQAAAESSPSDETALHHSANAIVEGLLDLDESLSPIRPLGVPIGSVDPLGLASISMPPVIATSFLVPPAQANPELLEQLLKALYQWLQTLTPAQAEAIRAALLPLYIALSELAGGISGAALRQLLYGLRHLIAASRSVGANVGRLLWRWIVILLGRAGVPPWAIRLGLYTLAAWLGYLVGRWLWDRPVPWGDGRETWFDYYGGLLYDWTIGPLPCDQLKARILRRHALVKRLLAHRMKLQPGLERDANTRVLIAEITALQSDLIMAAKRCPNDPALRSWLILHRAMAEALRDLK